ncbi:50S ribosomal protein L4 [Candidatus Bipolaricaulota bacterium]|nr:50S ribosomal protein L4 [Candidatus Bipolaricaulota bacterium]
MPKAKLYRFHALDAGPGEVEVPEALFGGPIHQDLLYRAVRVYLMNQRQGTAKAKTRGEVAGGGRKPWRQKGTGRARHGSIRSPIWRHGGVTFGPVPHKVRLALPKKMRRKALVSALSARCQAGRLVLIDKLGFERPRTKEGLALLEKLASPRKTLVVVAPEEWRVEVTKTFSNIPGVECVRSDFLAAYHVLAYEGLLMTERAVETLARRLGHG